MHHPLRGLLVAITLLLLALAAYPAAQPASAQTARLCFLNVPGITNCIEGRFRQYWEQNGGLLVFGYPVSAAAQERNRDTGKQYLTQWFERNRFELHPENRRPYDVLLGRLGDDMLLKQGREWQREWVSLPPTTIERLPPMMRSWFAPIVSVMLPPTVSVSFAPTLTVWFPPIVSRLFPPTVMSAFAPTVSERLLPTLATMSLPAFV